MKEEQYLTFQKFNDPGLATELADLLSQNNIDYIIDETKNFDPTFSNSKLNNEVSVKLKKADFEKANALLLQNSWKQIESVTPDHYLFEFTDEELIEIISKPEEWSEYDYLLAQKILKDRGKEINPEIADTLRQQRLIELAKPEEFQRAWVYGGYSSAILGGLISIFIGLHLSSYKKTLPNGDRVYGFSPSDRKHGNRIFFFGLISFLIWVVVRIIKYKNLTN